MRRLYKVALIVPALCLAAGIGAGSVLPERDGRAAEASAPAADALSMVNLGAFTFHVEQPRHVTYVVTRMAAGFADEQMAEQHSEAEKVVRLRDAVFDAVLDIRPDAVTGEVDLAALQARVERRLAERLPDLAMVEVRVLGTQDVPRR
jgi:hypothetical protein